jgi:hypothetical protein
LEPEKTENLSSQKSIYKKAASAEYQSEPRRKTSHLKGANRSSRQSEECLGAEVGAG